MSLHITSTTVSANTKSCGAKPSTKDELRKIIEFELEHQGPDADLNFIDTSKITDMYSLFRDLTIRNIKIDQWDVSNVGNMSYMFHDCKEFNADLSGWDVSNVEVMDYMFDGCYLFNSDLSSWETRVAKVKYAMGAFSACKSLNCDLSGWKLNNLLIWNDMFYNCPKMQHELKPKRVIV